MKKFKRIVGLLLCLAMMLSFVPASVVSAAESTGTSAKNTTTNDILEKIDITGTAVGACSTDSASHTHYTDYTWYNEENDWNKHERVTDGNAETDSEFSVGGKERGDFYLDLTKKNGSAISADHLKLHYGPFKSANMPTVTITLDLSAGDDVVKTFTTNWSGETAGDPIEWDFDETYTIDGIYVWAQGSSHVSFAEIELYEYTELPSLTSATLNGRTLSDYVIVCDDQCLDYDRTAAEYIQKAILMKTGVRVPIVDDSTSAGECEIIVGATDRAFSETLSAPTNHAMKFAINANGTKIAMEADYFIIAGAAYYFVETYINNVEIGNNSFASTCTTDGAQEVTPITKPAKNYIMLIGDGMGVMQTRLWEKHGPSPTAEDNATYGYSDGENIFYGEYLPYKGFSQTANIYGTITDSAAGGTALSTGYKTINGYVGRDQYENDIKNLSEIAWDMGKAVGIMSTEGSDGATPASFSAHTSGRYDDEVVSDQDILEAQGYVFVERYRGPEDAYNAVFKTYTAEEFGRWDAKVKVGMSKLVNDPDGFFVMYEEAYIDKLCHALEEENNPNATTTEDIFRAMYRFNQHIAYFMEFAMYNPDTFILITADHETGGLNENWEPTQFNVAPETGNDHSLQDVPVYVYGQGGEVFHGVTAENTSIGRTFAHIMTNGDADDFGDPQYPILLGSSSGEDVQLPTPEGLKATATTDTSITVTANGVYGGTLKFRINGGEWQSSGIFTGLTANTTYTIEAMHDAANGYIDSDIATITVTTAEPAVKVELEPVPTNKLTNAMFGYYGQNISGDITTHLYSNEYPANRVIDGADTETRSGAYNYSDLSGTLENQQKVPVIYIELTEATVLGGVEIQGWEYDRYNMENFVVQITTEENNDNWKTVATVTQAFTEGERGADCPPLTVEFNKTYTAYKVRILVDSISDMSSEAQGDDAGLAQYGYIRVKEVALLYDPSATPGQAPGDPTEPTTPTEPTIPTEKPTEAPTQAPTTPVGPVGPVQITVQSAIVGVYDDGMTRNNLIDQKDGSAIIDGDTDTSVTLGNASDGGTVDGGWVWGSAFAGNGGTYTPAAILTLSEATRVGSVEVYPNASNGKYTPTKITVQAMVNGNWQTVGSYENEFWDGPAVVDFAAVDATKIRVLVEDINVVVVDGQNQWAHWQLPEIKVYGEQAGGEDPEDPTDPTDPDVLPSVTLEPITNAPTPIVGYYTDKNTNGNITEYLNEDTVKGKVPAVLVDGKTGSSADYNWTGYYRYDDVASGAKIPAYLFEFDEPTAFTGVKIDGYKAMYYGMENFTVQVYIEGKGWVTATTVADSFGAQTQEEYADPITYPFAEPLYGTKIRILVDKLWNMYDWRYDDEESFNLEYEASIRLREITLMEDPDYVPPVDAGNTLMPPSSLNTEFTDTTITAVAPPSTQYSEAEIRYAVYLDGQLVAANSTGIFTGLQPNTRYTVYAKYIGDGEIWQNSSAISNTTATDKLKLPTPNVEVDLTSTSITATADEVEGGELQFRLLNANHVAIGEWQSSGNFTGLTPNTTYYIQARYNGDTNHYDSEVRTLEVETGKTLLSKPTLTVSGTTYNTITLNALPTVTGGTAEYSYRVEGGEWIVASSNVITGLTPNTTYELRARYVATDDSYNTSLYSEVVTATTMKAPLPAPNVSATVISDSEITATANTNDNGTLMFSVDGIKWFEADANGSYPFTGLNRNTKYTVQAKYVGKNGYSDSEIATIEATTAKTQLTAPTSLTISNITANSFTVQAPVITGGTLQFQLKLEGEAVYGWQNADANGRYTFNELTDGKIYTIEAKYVADEDYIDSAVRTDEAKTLTILSAPDLSATSTDVTITATAPAVTGGTLKFRINGGKWQDNGNFSGLKSNTQYTIEAMYEAEAGYVSSKITKITVTTQKGVPGTNGDYAYLEAIRESDVTAHVGYNRYSNHEMLSENLEQSALISDGMYGTIAKIMGAEAVSADKLADGYRLLSIVYDLNNGTTKLGAIEITGGDYNLTKFAIQVRNTKGVWQTVKFVTNDLFDISEQLRNKTVLIPFTPVEGTQVRLLINGYEANDNNYPEIRELVIYEVKDDARQELKAATSTDAAAAVDGNKATVFTGNTVTMSFDVATSVKRLKLFGNTESDSINGYTIKVQTAKGGEWTEVASGNAYSRAFNTSIVNLDKEYMAYGVQVIANGTAAIPEIEVYGYIKAPDYVDPTPPTTPGATAPTEPTRAPVVSPEATPAATQAATIPTGDVGMVDPTVAPPSVDDESGDPVIPGLDIEKEKAEDPTVATPAVGDESAADPVAPTAPVATKPVTVMGWLDAIPASDISPKIGVYSGNDRSKWTTLSDEYSAEAAELTDVSVSGNAYIRGKNNNVPSGYTAAAVLSWEGAKMIGGIELIAQSEKRITKFDIEYKDAKDGTWKATGVNVTSDPYATTGGYTWKYTFDVVSATAIRIIVNGYTSDRVLREVTVYEVKTGEALEKIEVNSVTSNKGSTSAAATIDNVIDGEKGDVVSGYYNFSSFPAEILFKLSSAQEISRVKIYAFSQNNYNPTDVKIEILNGSTWKTVFDDKAYTSSAATDVFECNFDAVKTTQVKVTVENANIKDGVCILTEVELYGPGEADIVISGSGADGTYTPGTAGMTQLDLTGRVQGADSQNTNSNSDYSNLTWYTSKPENATWRPEWKYAMVDNDPSNEFHYGVSSHERADFYLDLTNGPGGYTAIDGFKMVHTGYINVPKVTLILVLANGTVTKEYTPNFTTKGQVLEDTFDQTYSVKGVYVWEPENKTGYTYTSAAFGDFALYQKQTVTLDAPTVDWTSKNDTSITVCAPKINASIGKLQFSKDGTNWFDADANGSCTFTKLTGNTTYTIQAKYVATATGYVTSAPGSVSVKTEVTPTTSFIVSGTTTAGATVQLYKDKKVVATDNTTTDGSFGFTNVSIGTYTLVATLKGYDYKILEVVVNANKPGLNMTLSQAVYTVSGTTTAGATVQLYKDGAPVSNMTTVATNGSYTFNNVPIGAYTVVVTLDGYYGKTQEIVVKDATTVPAIALDKAAYTVSGTTTAGATVKLYKDGNLVAGKEVVANGGSYTFNEIPVGAYTLVATLDGYHARKEVIIVGAAVSQDMTLSKAAYTVSGTVTGDTADAVTVTLYKNGEAVKSVTTADGKYTFTDVVIGNYSLMVTKANHIAQGATITVNNADVTKDFALEYVKPYVSNVVEDAIVGPCYNVRLYEPWALRVNVTFYEEFGNEDSAIPLSNFKSYGAYAVIAHKFGDGKTEPKSWRDIVNDPNAVQFRQAAGEGDGNMFADGDTTAVFDYYDGLYTYRLAENVYWVAYYEDMEGTIHFTEVRRPVLLTQVENIIGKIAGDADQDTQRIVLEHMHQLHYALKDFRGEDAEFGNIYEPGVLNYNQNLGENTTGGTKYQFGRSHRIRLIEPWGIMINMQVRVGGVTYGEADFEAAQDYGLIFFHDKDSVYNGAMTRDQMLARNDVYIYSDDRGNAWLESWNTAGTPGITAAYDLDIFTYEMDSELYYMAFVVDAEGNYHYSNAYCLNIIDQMYAYYNNTTLKGEERLTFKAMIQLHESTLIHRKKYGK